ncbi:MAG: DUF1579 family protein [Gammaproteobacteria bacterium]
MNRRNVRAFCALIACAIALAGVATAQDPAAVRQRKVSPEMAHLAQMIGNWSVEFESRNAPDEPFTRLNTASNIEPLLGGAFLQEKISLPTPRGRSIELIGIWGFDRFRSVYRFAWLDDSYALFDVHEGRWSDGVLVVDNTRARTTLPFDGQEFFSRMRWGPVETNGFVVEFQVSIDGGTTWVTLQRGRYSRSR